MMQFNALAPGQMPTNGTATSQPAQNALLGGVQGYHQAMKDWRGNMPAFDKSSIPGLGQGNWHDMQSQIPGIMSSMGGLFQQMQDWRSQRPDRQDYGMGPEHRGPGGFANMMPQPTSPITAVPPVMQPGGGTTGAPLPGTAAPGAPNMVGSSLGVIGASPSGNPYQLPTYPVG